ncbi:uncharacterized protein L201_005636 [Kwoniella dendrophila CBS 6074]|uniref:Uncharacterized protein n=1 Tax=Kwoniella dendrophila CBS 6074 TaxID=1295534 RepID=A0AAX4K0N8_9TREE
MSASSSTSDTEDLFNIEIDSNLQSFKARAVNHESTVLVAAGYNQKGNKIIGSATSIYGNLKIKYNNDDDKDMAEARFQLFLKKCWDVTNDLHSDSGLGTDNKRKTRKLTQNEINTGLRENIESMADLFYEDSEKFHSYNTEAEKSDMRSQTGYKIEYLENIEEIMECNRIITTMQNDIDKKENIDGYFYLTYKGKSVPGTNTDDQRWISRFYNKLEMIGTSISLNPCSRYTDGRVKQCWDSLNKFKRFYDEEYDIGSEIDNKRGPSLVKKLRELIREHPGSNLASSLTNIGIFEISESLTEKVPFICNTRYIETGNEGSTEISENPDTSILDKANDEIMDDYIPLLPDSIYTGS